MLSAMSLLILLGIAAIVVLIVVDVVAIRRDGYGTNPPPRSPHAPDPRDALRYRAPF